MNRKTFVLDTNVLLHDPEALQKFPENDVVIHVMVLEELDRMKRLPNELGKNARAIFQFLDASANSGKGDLHHGVKLENNSNIRIQLHVKMDGSHVSPGILDNKIIMAAYYLQEKGERVVFYPRISLQGLKPKL